jgi:tetratricopeptide (TPR) repeat protein
MLYATLLIIAMGAASTRGAHSVADHAASSSTIIGPDNPLLVDGALALEAGKADEGIRLTLEGLKFPSPPHDTAAAHANLCAGYALLHQWDEALAHCNTAIALDQGNWRAYNNRAAVFTARGLYDQAIADVQSGLKLAPDSVTLQKSLKIIRENQKISRHHGRSGANA